MVLRIFSPESFQERFRDRRAACPLGPCDQERSSGFFCFMRLEKLSSEIIPFNKEIQKDLSRFCKHGRLAIAEEKGIADFLL